MPQNEQLKTKPNDQYQTTFTATVKTIAANGLGNHIMPFKLNYL